MREARRCRAAVTPCRRSLPSAGRAASRSRNSPLALSISARCAGVRSSISAMACSIGLGGAAEAALPCPPPAPGGRQRSAALGTRSVCGPRSSVTTRSVAVMPGSMRFASFRAATTTV